MLSFLPLNVLDEIWDLIKLVSDGFPTYSFLTFWFDFVFFPSIFLNVQSKIN